MVSNGSACTSSTRHKVAAVQIASVAYDLIATLDKVQKWAQEAAEAGAELVVFPEALVSAYPRKLGFQIGARSPEDRVWYKRYLQVSTG
jgi:predicted amidohydrolase